MILCRSADRRGKERAMHDRFSASAAASKQQSIAWRLAARIDRSKKCLDPAQVMQVNRAVILESLEMLQRRAGLWKLTAHGA